MAWFPHKRTRIVMLVPCQGGSLREKPAAAVVRAVAPYFYALRERKRRGRGRKQCAGDRASSCRSSPARRPTAGRARPNRLRDRLRAVSYRILRMSRLASLDAPQATNGAGEVQPSAALRGGSRRSPVTSSTQQLPTTMRWVRKRVKPFLTSDFSRTRLVRWYVVEIYSRSGTARKRFESLAVRNGPQAL